MDSTLQALQKIVGQAQRSRKAGVFGDAPPRKRRSRPVARVPHPSDQSRVEGFQRALRQNRASAPRRSAPRPPY